MKPGRKKYTLLQWYVFKHIKAIGRLSMEFHYGTQKRPRVSLSQFNRRLALQQAKNRTQEIITAFTLQTIYRYGKSCAQRIYQKPWKTLKANHQILSHALVKLGLAKNINQAAISYDNANESANNAAIVLQGFAGRKPSAEDAFYVILKLDLSPALFWPEDFKYDLHLLHLIYQVQQLFAHRKTITLNASDLLRFQMIGKAEYNTAHTEIGRGIENLLSPLFKMIAASNKGINTFMWDVINRETNQAVLAPHPVIAYKMEQPDGSYKVITWKEIESVLNE
ncbi:hypothetical protein [Terasakiella pusilla]|jgi:hypothetical protein|uniref:hypothetical protein n=1 Tax=Terasakiella pusilla TaxID=64973 RepID=UPI003AA7B5D2